MIKYIPSEAISAKPTSTQNKTATVSVSQLPTRFGPYWDMLSRTVPNETMAAGINSLSVGCRKDALNVSG